MKKLLFIAAIFFLAFQSKGQNEPELIQSISGPSVIFQTEFIYIDHGLPKISFRSEEEITLYNLDFTLYRTVVIPAPINESPTFENVFYVTRSLFDCDTTDIEYYARAFVDGLFVNGIYNEDGTEYFNFGNESAQGFNSITSPSNEASIVSDSEGSYILTSDTAMKHLYKLCGQVPQPLARSSDGTILSGVVQQGNNNGFDAYPNPARETIKFEYDLQGHKKANLQLFNTSGQLMKEMMLGQAFDFIRLNISDLEQGTYIARITTDDGFELSEKFVKVD